MRGARYMDSYHCEGGTNDDPLPSSGYEVVGSAELAGDGAIDAEFGDPAASNRCVARGNRWVR